MQNDSEKNRMNCTESVAAVIPSLNPDERFVRVITSLAEAGFAHILVVDDGSDADHKGCFEKVAAFPAVTVLTHEVNKGKGRALKTAFAYLLKELPDLKGVVTADGDGQHLTEDILACGQKMLEEPGKVIMGCRNFKRKDIPKRNRFGNRMTSFAFLICCGIRLSDTQTGLRAIPTAFLPAFLEIEGERFEYETNMLLQMKRQKIVFLEQPIATVYDEKNYTSHYNPFKDSWRIFKVMFKFILSSLGTTLLDLICFHFLFRWLSPSAGSYAELLATVIARLISSFTNYNINNKAVFKNRGSYRKSLFRYYCLAVPQMLVSAGLLTAINRLLGNSVPILTTLLKMLVDTALFFASHGIQREWVFKKNKS